MELYNKYRPDTPDKILGNDLAIKSMKSEIANGHHCFLITGESGCGKTTLARAVALEMGCNELSIHEVNASDDRGIESMRQIKEQVRYAPTGNEKEVFILDECHGITAAAQESLLKILEECPEYCYFFLCTTNPEKLIDTIMNRCSRIEMQPLDLQTMTGLLRRVVHYEQKTVDLGILQTIASLSKGSSRMALKILGSVLYMETDEERREYLNRNTFSDDDTDAIELCRALIKQEGWGRYTECLTKLSDKLDSNAEGIRQMIMSYAVSVLKKSQGPTSSASAAAATGMLQVFSQADTYKNKGKAIWVAILDFMAYMAG